MLVFASGQGNNISIAYNRCFINVYTPNTFRYNDRSEIYNGLVRDDGIGADIWFSNTMLVGVCSTPWSQYYSDTSPYHMNIFKLITDTEYTTQQPADQSYGVKSYFSDIILINIDK